MDIRERSVKLFFEKQRYKKMLRDELKVSYGMKHAQEKEQFENLQNRIKQIRRKQK